jgi:hypothetical protein
VAHPLIGSTKAFNLIFEKFKNIEITDSTGGSALHIAAFTGQLETVKLLVEVMNRIIVLAHSDALAERVGYQLPG